MIIRSALMHVDLSQDEFSEMAVKRMQMQGCGEEGCEDCNGEATTVYYSIEADLVADVGCEEHMSHEHLTLVFTRDQIAMVCASAIKSLGHNDPEEWSHALSRIADVEIPEGEIDLCGDGD